MSATSGWGRNWKYQTCRPGRVPQRQSHRSFRLHGLLTKLATSAAPARFSSSTIYRQASMAITASDAPVWHHPAYNNQFGRFFILAADSSGGKRRCPPAHGCSSKRSSFRIPASNRGKRSWWWRQRSSQTTNGGFEGKTDAACVWPATVFGPSALQHRVRIFKFSSINLHRIFNDQVTSWVNFKIDHVT